MKIALCGPTNEFTRALRKGLETSLPDDQLLDWQPKEAAPAEDLDVLVALGPVTRDMLQSQGKLTLVQTASDGYDAVETDAATEMGIWVSYSPGAVSGNADSVAEFAVMLLIAANRHVGQALRFEADHAQPRPMLTPSLIGKTVCIYGYGTIGKRVAARLKPFGVKLFGVNRDPSKITDKDVKGYGLDQRDEALGAADAVVLCVRGSKQNRHLVNEGFLNAMKPGATLVNIARGTLVDETALLAAVHSGHLGAAGLDVQEHEPIASDSPLLAEPNLFVTPHIAGFTDHTLQGTVNYLRDVIGQVKKSEKPRSLINDPKKPRLVWKS